MRDSAGKRCPAHSRRWRRVAGAPPQPTRTDALTTLYGRGPDESEIPVKSPTSRLAGQRNRG